MKKSHHPIYLRWLFRCMLLLALISGINNIGSSQAETEETEEAVQEDSTAVEEEVEAVPEKEELRMSLEAFKSNGAVRLLSRVRSKVGTKWQNTAGIEVSFYREEVSPENLMGKDTSNALGETSWMPPQSVAADSTFTNTYYSVVMDHPDYEDVEEMISVYPSTMKMELVEEDSIKTINVHVEYPDEAGAIIPLAEAECQLYVQRLFGLLPLGDPGTTDEEGNVTFEFPADIPGDEAGKVVIVAKIAEHELLGNIEVQEASAWGVPVKENDFYTQRQLWSARANSPIILIIVVNAAIIGIWGVIAFIFLEIFRINKLGKVNK